MFKTSLQNFGRLQNFKILLKTLTNLIKSRKTKLQINKVKCFCQSLDDRLNSHKKANGRFHNLVLIAKHINKL